ncbi:uncharacterized protein LOC135162725 isoform X2 [Diachasmimorpha longicaudata]
MSNPTFKNYKYLLVHFIEEGATFDIAANPWVKYDEKKKQFLSLFHAGDESELTESLLRTYNAPPKRWKYYPVDLRGGADTYDIALERLQILKDLPYGFSDHEHSQQKIEGLKKMIILRKTNHNHYEIKDLFSQAGGPLDDKDDDRISIEVDESSDTGDKENVKKQRNKRSDGERKRKQIVADSSPEMENEMEIEKSSKLREERRKVVSDSSPEEFVKRKKISKKKTVFTDSSPQPSSKRRRIEKKKTDQGSTEIDKEMEIARSKSSTSQKTKTQGLLTASSASNITNSDQKVVGDRDVTDSVDVQPSSSRRRFDCEKKRSTSMMDNSPQTTSKSSHASIVHTPATFPRMRSTVALAQHLPNSNQDPHQLLLLCLRLLRNLTSAVGQLKGDMVQMREDWSNDRTRNVERQVPLSGNLHHHYCDSVDKLNQFNNRLLLCPNF